jgi:hypothetical protein
MFRYSGLEIECPNGDFSPIENALILPSWTIWTIWAVMGGYLKRETFETGQ